MSKNRKYIEEFDRKAGRPSDFDSLFGFEKGELYVKRRIRIKKQSRRIAAMCTAAAVIGFAVFACLTYISTDGIDTDIGISEGADITEAPVSMMRASDIPDNPKISSFTGRFDYVCEKDVTANVTWQDSETVYDAEIDPDAVIRFRLVSKEYRHEDGETVIQYEISPIEKIYRYADYNVFNDNITFSVLYRGQDELQTGCEYIMPFTVEDTDYNGFIERNLIMDRRAYPMRHTEKGWVFSSEGIFSSLVKYSERVDDDVDYLRSLYLCPDSVDIMQEIHNLMLTGEAVTGENAAYRDHSKIFGEKQIYILDDILGGTYFESLSYGIKEDGSEDRTLIVLENKDYLNLFLNIETVTVFSGVNELGEFQETLKLIGVDINQVVYPCTMTISGFTGLSAITSPEPNYPKEDIGFCAENQPLYMQIIDNFGRPMEIEINSETVNTEQIVIQTTFYPEDK